MKQETALQYVNYFMVILQRYRSITKENLLGDGGGLTFTDKRIADIWPWVFGEKCPLSAIEKILDRGTISPLDFYNLMFLLDRFMPEVKVSGAISYQIQFPDPDTEWLPRWEELSEEKK